MGRLDKRCEGSHVEQRRLVEWPVELTTQIILSALEAADFFQSGKATRQVGQGNIPICLKCCRNRFELCHSLPYCRLHVLKPVLERLRERHQHKLPCLFQCR